MHLNHPQIITHSSGPWKNCLPQTQSLVPKRLGAADLEDPENTFIKSRNGIKLDGTARPVDDRFKILFSQINWIGHNGDKLKVLHLGF